ncbi:MAG: hypothetical protein ICV60_05350 [Pyrinomonadaceae bacterium]|nr:hypothetical protein [Pyrinomonadaceae bacterium]
MGQASDQTKPLTADDESGARRRSRADSLLNLSAASLMEDEEEAPASASASAGQSEELIKLLAEVGTGLWRLRRSMTLSATSELSEELQRASRHLEAVINVLAEGGIQIRDHTGEAVPEGGIYALKTVAFEQTPGLSSEQVIETIKPTIYFQERMIQMGEVVVGTPVKTSD